jgi:predicted hydrocarbon binding protein
LVDYPKDMMVYVFGANKRFFHVVIQLKNEPGALSAVSALLAQARFNILEGFTSTLGGKDIGTWSFFAEATEGSLTSGDLKALLVASKYVGGVVVNESENGFLLDTIHFPLRWNSGERAMTMRTDTFTMILNRMKDIFGSGGDVIVYHQGREAGRQGFGDLARDIGDGKIASTLTTILPCYAAVGWGRPELISADPESSSITLRMWGNFECEGQKSEKPNSQFIRGHIAGLFSKVMAVELECSETKCTAMVESYCEFVVSKTKHILD